MELTGFRRQETPPFGRSADGMGTFTLDTRRNVNRLFNFALTFTEVYCRPAASVMRAKSSNYFAGQVI